MLDTVCTVAFAPLARNKTRLADFIYRQVFDAIIAGRLPPGDRVVQEQLAAEMEVSRTPVREALLRLEAEGIVESSGRGGFVVRSLGVDEARKIYDLRAAIEGYAARMVAEQGDPGAIESIRQAISKTGAGASSVEEGFELNRAVHRSIVVATGNSMFIEAVDAIWGRSQAFLLYAKLHAADLRFLDAEPTHEAVLAAIESGDGVAAQGAMVGHILSGLDLQAQALRSAIGVVT
ncbi:MAG: GntR family transcriptional regulator [Acidimicrobiia bacterium]